MVESEQLRKINPLAFSLSTMLLLTTLLCVAIGLTIKFPVVGCVVNVISIPVFVYSVKIVRHRQSHDKTVTALEKVSIFLVVFVAYTLLLALWLVSFVSCLFGLCGSMIPNSDGEIGFDSWLFIAFVLGIGGLLISFLVSKKCEQRYHRETGKGKAAYVAASQTRRVEQEDAEGTES